VLISQLIHGFIDMGKKTKSPPKPELNTPQKSDISTGEAKG
jgi:hypothetical protein